MMLIVAPIMLSLYALLAVLWPIAYIQHRRGNHE
jgi:hypothetical protein